MAVEFKMPKLGLTMEQGTILKWLAEDGERIEAGSAVLLVETDKVETDIESPGAGTLHRIGVEGETYPCGDLIAWLLADDEQPPAGSAPLMAPPAGASVTTVPAPSAVPSPPINDGRSIPAGGRLLASPNARRVAAGAGVELRDVRGTGPGGRIVSEDVEDHLARRPAPVTARARINGVPAGAGASASAATVPAAVPAPAARTARASRAALALAEMLDIDVAAVSPSDPSGPVTREDVAAHARALIRRASDSAPAGENRLAPDQASAPVVPLVGMRGTVARRMKSSLQDMAQLTLTMDADMSAVVADRKSRAAQQSGRRPPGYTDYVVAAAARALRRHPAANSQIVDGGIALLPHVHVGVAVAADKGLFVPVVRDADTLSLTELAADTFRLAEAARAGGLRLEDLEGATFSVTALGMYGVDAFTPIINPPNAAILGVGRLRDDAVWQDDGSLGRRSRLTLSLTWDHRVLDGAPAAEFCRTIVDYLQDPSTLADAP